MYMLISKQTPKQTSAHLHTVTYLKKVLLSFSTHIFPPLKKPNINVSSLHHVSYLLYSGTPSSFHRGGCCHVSEVVSAHMCSGEGWQQAGSWIVLPWMVVAVPGQSCQLDWHQCSDSWFETRSGRQFCECVCFRLWCYLSSGPAAVQSWWYGRLGKQEIVGPWRLISPTHQCRLLWAQDGCLRGQVEGMDFSVRHTMCVCVCVCWVQLTTWRKEKWWQLCTESSGCVRDLTSVHYL